MCYEIKKVLETYLFIILHNILYIIYICNIHNINIIYNGCPDVLRFEQSVFLESKFFFHINAFRGEVNPWFFKMLLEKGEQ